MNDPLGNGEALALWCDHNELISKLGAWLAARASVKTGTAVVEVSPVEIQTDNGASKYDCLVNTLPLPLLKRLAPWLGLDDFLHRWLAIATFSCQTEPAWDYAYTPTLRDVSRITWTPGQVQMEVPMKTRLPHGTRLAGDAFSDGIDAVGMFMNGLELQTQNQIPGHLLPAKRPSVPNNWLLLGRFAEWDPRSTAERCLDRAAEWAYHLGRGQ